MAAAALLAACSPSDSGTALAQAPEGEASEAGTERHPVSGLEIIEVAVVRGDNRIVFRTELANTPEAQARGLMFRTELGPEHDPVVSAHHRNFDDFETRNRMAFGSGF
ncbi:MAG: hypothetical protein QNJ15_11590, partial [Erythrobacter sp.]|nr:hypothetical protein [Erythrobacter sp.]